MKTSFLFMLIFIVIILSTLVQPSIETMITGGYEDGMDNDNLNKEMQIQDAEDEQQEYDDDTGAPYANSYFTRNRDFNSGMVRGKDIEPGDEDLYILKSSVVPPVCPKCPDAKVCPRKKTLSTVSSVCKMPRTGIYLQKSTQLSIKK